MLRREKILRKVLEYCMKILKIKREKKKRKGRKKKKENITKHNNPRNVVYKQIFTY